MQNIEKMNIDLIMKTNSHLKPFFVAWRICIWIN